MKYKYFSNPLLPQLRCLPGINASPVPRGKSHARRIARGKRREFRKLSCTCWAAVLAVAAATAYGADEPGVRALQQQNLQRQQQQESLQLRMQQQQSATQGPPQDARQRQSLEQLQRDQARRQQELHYRQAVDLAAPQPAEAGATPGTKDDLKKLKTKEEGAALLRRFEAEQQKK
jgi:hypothetical protein